MQTYLTAGPLHLLAKPVGKKDRTVDDYHRDVMSLFPEFERNPRMSGNVLFRIERLERRMPQFLIRSTVEPCHKLDAIQVKREPDYSGVTGSFVSFRLAINAIKRASGGKAIPVKADGIGPNSEFYTWVQNKLADVFEELEIVNHDRELYGANREGIEVKGSKVIQVDTIDGIARVKDGEALQRVLVKGIGRAKSYGCGMLTVRVLQ